MSQKKWMLQTEFMIGLIAVVILLGMIAILSSSNLNISALPTVITNTYPDDSFSSTLPDRSLIFQVASEPRETPIEDVDESGANTPGGPIFFGQGDSRVIFEGPGAAAALAAVYPAPEGADGLDIYAIDPLTGIGQPAFHVSEQALADARAQEAITPGTGVLLGEGMGNQLWLYRENLCVLFTTYPDGKSAVFIFDC